eukprot:1946929-Prymnesium_polylepis.2
MSERRRASGPRFSQSASRRPSTVSRRVLVSSCRGVEVQPVLNCEQSRPRQQLLKLNANLNTV